MKLNRYKIELLCTYLAVVILCVMTVGVILFFAEETFHWNIFSNEFKDILGFLYGALGIILGATVLVSIMINLSIIAIRISSIDEKAGKAMSLKDGAKDEK